MPQLHSAWLIGVPALAMVVAVWLDRRWGEPPLWAHPVVAMGRLLSLAGPRLWRQPAVRASLGGALVWCLGAALSVGVAWALAHSVQRVLQGVMQWWLGGRAQDGSLWPLAVSLASGVAMGVLLKPLMAWRMLRDEVQGVEAALAESLPAGRARLARLVSRDVHSLSEAEVRESAIESLAENLNDSVVAPLCWFALAGLPGAALYRWANTADAMWGYRDHRRWMGAWAARADDVLSWLPARLTAGLLCLSARRWSGWRAMRQEAALTPSPNGGWPMGTMALLLGASLGKPGVYRLNATAPAPQAGATAQALHWAGRAVGWCVLCLSGLGAVRALWAMLDLTRWLA